MWHTCNSCKTRYVLTLPFPISHLCENYLPLPISHLCEFHMTCIHALIAMEIFHYMHGWKSPARMVSGMNAMLSWIFTLCDVRMRIAITCTWCPGATSGVLIKKVVVWGLLYQGEVGRERVKIAVYLCFSLKYSCIHLWFNVKQALCTLC